MSRVSNLPGATGVDVSVAETTTPPPLVEAPVAEKSQSPASGQTVERYQSSSADAAVGWANPYDKAGPSVAASALAFGSAAAWKAFDNEDVTFGSSTKHAANGAGAKEKTAKGQKAEKAEKKQKPKSTLAEQKEAKALQRDLNLAMKAGLAVDGDAGEKTQAALKKFQRDNQLPEGDKAAEQTKLLLKEKAREVGLKGLTEKMQKHEANLPGMWQNDPRWGSESVNGTSKGIGAVGCAITDLAMLVSAKLGRVVTPDEVNEKLQEGGVFQMKGSPNLTFPAVGSALLAAYGEGIGELQHVTRSDTEVNMSPKQIKDVVDSELKAGRKVMLHVDYANEPASDDTDNLKGDHWVIIYKGENGKYKAMDPAYGEDFTYTFTKENGFASDDVRYDRDDKGRIDAYPKKLEKYDEGLQKFKEDPINNEKPKGARPKEPSTGLRTAVGVVTFSPPPLRQTAQKD